MRPKARQSFSLGWVLVRSKKAPSQVLHEIAVFSLTINGRAQTGNGEGAIFQGVLLMLQNGANSGNRFGRGTTRPHAKHGGKPGPGQQPGGLGLRLPFGVQVRRQSTG